LIVIKIDCEKLLAHCASVLECPRPVVQLQSDERRRDRSWTHIEQVAHQGALPLDDCRAVTELCRNKDDVGTRFWSWLSRLVISRRETTRMFMAPGEVIPLQLGDELILVSSPAASRARKTRGVENHRLSSPAIPHPR
jgi:hypothetical protein